MELRVNDYIRTKYGITQYKEYDTQYGEKILAMPINHMIQGFFANVEDIINSSSNIIDLIEVGDYVNGCPVLHKENNELVCGLLLRYKEENIQNVVTKEQFESMEYKVGE